MKLLAKSFIVSLAVGLLLGTGQVWAQTTTVVSNDLTVVSGAEVVVDTSTLKATKVNQMPTQWGLWWVGAKEKLSLLFTLDPVKKAEKRLLFAQERLKYAEYISANATDAKRQEWAQKMVEKADQYMEKVEAGKEKWSNNSEAVKNQLRQNTNANQIQMQKVKAQIKQRAEGKK
ncbi:MAG: hypothetical protein COU31_03390 [Candidatus Magasanikbacteria bacterium CG10_big_fil_rev_8_21_14_0_10_40_10]|uniref:DUF5667 domain-containing protein n=1 Tax=Candidatus Magasanikbacteria bacterium CG10_big_fil_rev_8_21_14_0_10_40_10 TaxID=1974648 RepID=A0A2M6W3K6_9BACT|nr:MAG: hypothetical protein COU31_03390 [Candidatus Magasanikbacteria bacterium CG10_big_fil_rev_8_21_14_0_10_40_10]